MEDILYATPGNPVPGNHTAGYFKTRDGVSLRYAVFRADIPVAKGTVIILHGRNESIEKYFETIADLTAMGLWVATFDLRGQGGSDRLMADRTRGHVRRFSHYEDDVLAFLDQVILPDTRLPFFLLGHSTGALIALSMVEKLAGRIDRMVLAAPFLGITGQPLPSGGIRFLATALSIAGLGQHSISGNRLNRPFEGNPLTSDERRFRRNGAILERHPELALGPPSARWLAEALAAIARISKPEYLTKITIPTVLLAPVLDGIVPYATQEALSRHFRACQLIPITGARHELFQERDLYRAQALAAVEAFIPGSDVTETGFDAIEQISEEL